MNQRSKKRRERKNDNYPLLLRRGFFIAKNFAKNLRKLLHPKANTSIIKAVKEKVHHSLLERGNEMIRRRFTTEEACEKIDDAQNVIVDLLGRYDGFSQNDAENLEKAWRELREVMYSLDEKITTGNH